MRGYHLATFVDGILAYHPVYRESAFELMRDGFPLLKRQFLYENPFSQPPTCGGGNSASSRSYPAPTSGDGTQPAPGGPGMEPAPQLLQSLAGRRPGRMLPAHRPRPFDDEDRWTPSTLTGGSSRSTHAPG